MVEIKKRLLNEISINEITEDKQIYLTDLIIEKLDFSFLEVNSPVTIENCIIEEFLIHSCWFCGGLVFKNNIIKREIDYQMGGHNNQPIIISNNIFLKFFNFFDCHFNDTIEVTHNIFLEGTNLLGNLDSGFKNLFEKGNILKDNIGDLAIDKVL